MRRRSSTEFKAKVAMETIRELTLAELTAEDRIHHTMIGAGKRQAMEGTPMPETDQTLALMAEIDTVFMNCPWYGSRQMARHL